MNSSKFFFSTLIAASAMSATAYSVELTTVATMTELVSAGTLGEGVSLDTSYTSASTVYDFTGSGAITGISSESVRDAVNQDTGWITIAAYINPDAVSNIQSIFGYGAQQDGFKFATNGSALQFTTKGVSDIQVSGNDVTAGAWTLVAVTINLAGGSDSRYLVGDSGFYTRDFGTWTDPEEANQTFAIGSGNSTGDRELFSGSIANLTVFTSTERATNADVLAALGAAPIIQIDTTGKLVWAGTQGNSTWNTSTDNTIWLDGETPKAFTEGADVAFTDDATVKTVSLVSGSTVTSGDVTVGGSGYSFVVDSGTSMISGKTLTVSGGVTLSVGNSKNRTVGLEFENIVLAGKISYNNGDDTWSALDFAGGELHISDGTTSGSNLTITSATVSADSTVTAEWDKALNIGTLSGSANLSMTGGSTGRLTVGISDLSEYTGTLTTNNGSWGLTVNLGTAEGATTSSANVNINSGKVNVVGETTLNGTVTQNGGELALGANTEVGTLKVGTGTVSGTEGAEIGTLYFGTGGGLKTTTLSGSLNILGNMLYDTDVNNEKVVISEGSKISVKGTFGTTSADANDQGQESSVLEVGNGASFDVGTIAHGDQLTVTLGAGASISADSLTLNSVWGEKSHTFTGQGSESSKVVAEVVNLNGSMTLALNSVRMDIGSISGSKPLSLTNATLGVTETSSGWSTDASVTMSGLNAADVASGKAVALSGVLSGENASLTKLGGGDLELSGANTYSGGTTIDAGTLIAGSNSALGTNSVKISGGKLEVNSGVTVSNSITVVLGDALDAAVITGDGSLSGKITLDYAASAENVALALVTEETTKTYTLLSGNVGLGLTTDSFEVGAGWADGWKISDYTYENGVGTLTLTIPEPSAFGLLAGAGALALVVSRRRRSRR